MIEYIILVLLITLVIAFGVILFLLLRRGKSGLNPGVGSRFESEIVRLGNDINQKIQLVFAEKMAELNKNLGENNTQTVTRLSAFEKETSEALAKSLLETSRVLNERVDKMNETVSRRVQELSEKINANLLDINKKVATSLESGFQQNAEAMTEVKVRLERIDLAQKNLDGLQKEVINLNGLLTNSQARGHFGELQLEMLLESTFPDGKGRYYFIQDDFGYSIDGEKVRPDATIVFHGQNGPVKFAIDSKFSFSDYRKILEGGNQDEEEAVSLKKKLKAAVKTEVTEVAEKYIVPGKTIDAAALFIPSDGLFAYLSSEFPDLVAEARVKKVIIACPSTLQAIIVLFHNAAVDAERTKNLQVINEQLQRLGQEFRRLAERWGKLEGSMNAISAKTRDFSTTVRKITNQFDGISKNRIAPPEGEAIDYEEGEEESPVPLEEE